MSTIKQVITDPIEFQYAKHVPSSDKYYFARSDENARIPKPEPRRLPRHQRIPHLKRGGYKP